MSRKRIAQYCCAVLVAAGVGLNIQNAIADYGIAENSLSLVAGPGSNSGSNSNSISNTSPNLQLKCDNKHLTHYRVYTDSLGTHQVATDSVRGVSHGCKDGKWNWCHIHDAMICHALND